VTATSPASMPLHSLEGVVLEALEFQREHRSERAVTPASIVFTTTKLMRRSDSRQRRAWVEPEPPEGKDKCSGRPPSACDGRNGLGPAVMNLPIRGPTTSAPASRSRRHRVHHTGAAKSTAPCPRPQLSPALREPAAPTPVGEQACTARPPTVRKGESSPGPALGHRGRSGSWRWCPLTPS